MLRTLLRGLLVVLVGGYLVSLFWTGWLDRLPEPWQTVALVALLAVAALDVAAYASPRVARFLDGRDEP